ncbi:MAG: hypothetical protein ACJARS_000110, partial [bacterium]
MSDASASQAGTQRSWLDVLTPESLAATPVGRQRDRALM